MSPIAEAMGHPSRGIACLCSVLLPAFAACGPRPDGNPGWFGSDRRAEPPVNDRSTTDSVFDRPMERLIVRFSVVRLSAPRGTFTGDDAVWRLVKGPLTTADADVRLRLNGFRAAVGLESDRPALMELLAQVPDPHSALDQATPNESRLVELELGSCGPNLSVMFFDRAGRLHGRAFIEARRRLKLAYEMRAANLHEVWLQLMPELEEPAGTPRWVMTPNGPVQEPDERRHAFLDLVFEARIPVGGFLLLGPTPEVYDQPLAGRAFLVDAPVEGDPPATEMRESVVIINPAVTSLKSSESPPDVSAP